MVDGLINVAKRIVNQLTDSETDSRRISVEGLTAMEREDPETAKLAARLSGSITPITHTQTPDLSQSLPLTNRTPLNGGESRRKQNLMNSRLGRPWNTPEEILEGIILSRELAQAFVDNLNRNVLSDYQTQ